MTQLRSVIDVQQPNKAKSALMVNLNKKTTLKKVVFLKIYLAPRPGLEPGTCGLTVRRSTN